MSFDDAFSRFDTKHACDRRTDRHTELAWHVRAIACDVARKNQLCMARVLYRSLKHNGRATAAVRQRRHVKNRRLSPQGLLPHGTSATVPVRNGVVPGNNVVPCRNVVPGGCTLGDRSGQSVPASDG